MNLDLSGKKGIFDQLAEANGEELSSEEKDKFIEEIDTDKNNEGYYLDAFDNPISFNGIRQLKRSYTKLKLSDIHLNEIEVCSKDYRYFRRNYCKILTKNGIARPEPRNYQERAEDALLTGDDTVLFFSRQSGKCTTKETFVNINKDNVTLNLSIESVHNINLIEKYSKNQKRKEFVSIDAFGVINEKQEARLIELLQVVNYISFPLLEEKIKKLILDGFADNFILAIISMLEKENNEAIR